VLALTHLQLTHLQLSESCLGSTDVVVMVRSCCSLAILEIFNASKAFDVFTVDATALSRLPKLRMINLARSLLYEPTESQCNRVRGEVESYLPVRVVQHMMWLQRATPRIKWVFYVESSME
jgi:hypothetical protein